MSNLVTGDDKVTKNLDSLDLMKFILSFFVIAIHVPPVFGGGYTVILFFCRLAVPLFFITSSFLLFRRMCGKTEVEQDHIFKHYLIRSLKLYFSWFIVLFPWIILRRGYLKMDWFVAVITLIKDIVLGSTFRASWYLSSLIIGTGIIYMLGKKTNNKWIVIVSSFFYLCCVLGSGYGNVFPNFDKNLCTSPLVSLLWICIGKIIAEREGDSDEAIMSKTSFIVLFAFSIFIYIGEYSLCVGKRWAASTDALLSLALICPILFLTIKKMDITVIMAKKMRAFSVVAFCFHATIQSVFNHGFEKLFGFKLDNTFNCMLLYLLTVISCFLVTYILLQLGKRHKLARYFY